MTSQGMYAPRYEKIREEIHQQYDKLLTEKKALATQGTRFEQVMRSLPEGARPADPGFGRWVDDQLAPVLRTIEDLVVNDSGFPLYAYEDATRWRAIKDAATTAGKLITKDTIDYRGNARAIDRLDRKTGLVDLQGYQHPSPDKADEFGWAGQAGANYRDRVKVQKKAADQVALAADKIATTLDTAGNNVTLLYIGLLGLLAVLIYLLSAVAGVMAAVIGAINALGGVAAVIAALSTTAAAAIALFFEQVAAKLSYLATKIVAVITDFTATMVKALDVVGTQTQALTTLLTEQRSGSRVETSEFSRTGHWPNPVHDKPFPHTKQFPGGEWGVVTEWAVDE